MQDHQISAIIQLNHPNIVLAKGTFACEGRLEIRTKYFLDRFKTLIIPEIDSVSRTKLVNRTRDIIIKDILDIMDSEIVDSNFKTGSNGRYSCKCKIDL